MATINSGNSTTLYSTTQTTTSVNNSPVLPVEKVNNTNFTTLYSNTTASATGGGTSGNLLVTGNLRVLGTSDLEGAVTVSNSYILPTSDGTLNQVVTTDGNGNLTFQNISAIDNIPDGVGNGQLLVWQGGAWTANSNVQFDNALYRPRLVNNVSGGITALDILKKYTGTLADASQVASFYGFTDGTNITYTHRFNSEYDTTNNPILRVQVDPVGNFATGSTTIYTASRLDNTYFGINGNEIRLNLNAVGTPTINAALVVNRGTPATATLTWNESLDRWEFNNSLYVTGDVTASGDVAVNGGDLTTTASVGNLFNANATTVNVGNGATVEVNLGSTISGRVQVKSPSLETLGSATIATNLTVDSGTLFVNSATNMVGVNTLTPSYSLDVQGSGNVSNNFTVDGGTLFVNSSNNRVGINTLSPNYSLDVEGDAYVNSNLTVHGTTVGQFDVTNNSVSNLRVDRTSGFTGLNNTNPQAQLDVNGNAIVSGSVTASFFTIDNVASIDTATLTTTSTATVSLVSTTRNAIDVFVTAIQGANTHVVKATILRNGASAMITTYGEMYNTTSLVSFSADVSAGAIRLLITPTSATSTVFNAVRTSLN